MIKPQEESNFLREERSAMKSYFQNFALTSKEVRDYKKLAQMLVELVDIKTKIEVLEIEKGSLLFNRELAGIVGYDEKILQEKWAKKHAQYMRENKKYETKKKAYLSMV